MAWDKQLEQDFGPGGKHEKVIEKIDAEISTQKFTQLADGKFIRRLVSFCKNFRNSD